MKEEIKKFYKLNYEKKVFNSKKTHEEKTYYVLYLNAFEYESDNFVTTFVSYLPAYVKSNDNLNLIFDSDNVTKTLTTESCRIFKNSKVLAHRPARMDGLYGELFLDYYSRIIKEKKFFITYVAKRPYNVDLENYGYDQVYYSIENGNISLILAESKFVSNENSCEQSFLVDINGNEKEKSHFTKDYFNDYIGYVLEKGSFEEYDSEDDKQKIIDFIKDLNMATLNGSNLIDYIVEHNIKVNIVLFGIFQNNNENITHFESSYENLEQELKNSLLSMGLINTEIEIVFIPTKSKSMDIKGANNKFYEN